MITDLHQKALASVQSGQTKEAIEQLEDYLNQRPDNGFAWNDAGVLLFSQGRTEEALHYFQRAAELDNRPGRVFRNLALAYVKQGQPAKAARQLAAVGREGLLDAGLVGQIADAFAAQEDPASAMDTLFFGHRALPDATELDRRIEALRGRRAKIAFFWGGDGPTFLKEIIEDVRRCYPVRLFEGKTADQMHDLMCWSDISWFEWCTDLAVAASKLPKVCRTIVRLHRYEAYTPYPMQMQWDNIDSLVTVGNSTVLKTLNAQLGDICSKTSVVCIPNGVHLEAIPYVSRRAGKNLAFIGNLRMVKNPMLLVYCMAALKAVDRDYRLFIAGRMDDLLLKQYLEHAIQAAGLQRHIIWDGFQTDINGWLADKQYIVSTSLIESQGMGILEAMASGLKPVIHNFPGAEEIFGASYLFNTPEEFCRRMCEPDYCSETYRTFVERRYPLSQQLLRIRELLAAFERNPWPEQSAARPAHSARLSALAV